MKKTRIAVIFGGRSGEHEVSLMSARSVLSVLDPTKYEIFQIGITKQGQWLTGDNVREKLEQGKTADLTQVMLLPIPDSRTLFAINGSSLTPITEVDVVFPVLHGTFGEDGTLQGLLELADLPYVGAGVLGSSVGMDKALFKDVIKANEIPCLPSILLTRGEIETDTQAAIQKAEALADYPLFTKPANLGSSVGITKCKSRSDLFEGLMEAARYDRRVMVEMGLEKPREIEVSVLGNEDPIASVPGEIIPSADFYNYAAKYLDNSTELLIPANIDFDTAEKARKLAVKIFKVIDCAGLARVDFLLDRKTGDLFVSEINTIPGFTSISMYPKLWEATGVSYQELVERLISLALQRKSDRDRTERSFERAK